MINLVSALLGYIRKVRHKQKIPETECEERLKGKNVVVVGNAPNALQSDVAGLQDSFLIARCNDYTLQGFEDKLGTRTDIWCVGYHVYPDLVRKKQPPTTLTIVMHVQSSRSDFRDDSDPHTVHVFEDEMAQLHGKFGEGTWPSTGLMSICFLSTFCNVYFAGFDFFRSKKHYSSALQIHGDAHDTSVEEACAHTYGTQIRTKGASSTALQRAKQLSALSASQTQL